MKKEQQDLRVLLSRPENNRRQPGEAPAQERFSVHIEVPDEARNAAHTASGA
jgi:hypothetical protein